MSAGSMGSATVVVGMNLSQLRSQLATAKSQIAQLTAKSAQIDVQLATAKLQTQTATVKAQIAQLTRTQQIGIELPMTKLRAQIAEINAEMMKLGGGGGQYTNPFGMRGISRALGSGAAGFLAIESARLAPELIGGLLQASNIGTPGGRFVNNQWVRDSPEQQRAKGQNAIIDTAFSVPLIGGILKGALNVNGGVDRIQEQNKYIAEASQRLQEFSEATRSATASIESSLSSFSGDPVRKAIAESNSLIERTRRLYAENPSQQNLNNYIDASLLQSQEGLKAMGQRQADISALSNLDQIISPLRRSATSDRLKSISNQFDSPNSSRQFDFNAELKSRQADRQELIDRQQRAIATATPYDQASIRAKNRLETQSFDDKTNEIKARHASEEQRIASESGQRILELTAQAQSARLQATRRGFEAELVLFDAQANKRVEAMKHTAGITLAEIAQEIATTAAERAAKVQSDQFGKTTESLRYQTIIDESNARISMHPREASVIGQVASIQEMVRLASPQNIAMAIAAGSAQLRALQSDYTVRGGTLGQAIDPHADYPEGQIDPNSAAEQVDILKDINDGIIKLVAIAGNGGMIPLNQ